jgi:hypothetical protein
MTRNDRLKVVVPTLVLAAGWLPMQVAVAAGPRLSGPREIVPIVASVTVNPATLTAGSGTVVGTVTLEKAAGSGGVTVTLQSSSPVLVVPAGVVIQPGATSGTFVAETRPLPDVGGPSLGVGRTRSPASVNVDVSARVGHFPPKTARVVVMMPTVATLALDPPSVGGGGPVTGKLTITGPAPTGGLHIGVTSSAPTATVPAHVTVEAGATAASFPITTTPVADPTTVQITAAKNATVKSATLAIGPAALASLTFNPTRPVAGAPSAGTVKLSGLAPAAGFPVELRLQTAQPNQYNPCPPPVFPVHVTVRAGEASATFQVTVPPGRSQDVGIVASGAGHSVTGTFSRQFNVVSSTNIPPSVKGGTTIQARIDLAGPTPTDASCASVDVFFTSSNSLYVQVPDKVHVPGGSSALTVAITTSAVTAAQTVGLEIGAAYGGLGGGGGSFPIKLTLTVTP